MSSTDMEFFHVVGQRELAHDATLAEIVKQAFGLSSLDPRDADVRARLAPDRLRALADRLSPFALALVAEVANAMPDEDRPEILARFQSSLGISDDEREATIVELFEAGVMIVGTAQRRGAGSPRPLLALVEPFGTAIAEWVTGLAHEPPKGATELGARRVRRDAIAAASVAIHRPIRATKHGQPHGTSTKREEKRLGLPERSLDVALARVEHRHDGGMIRLLPTSLARLARGEIHGRQASVFREIPPTWIRLGTMRRIALQSVAELGFHRTSILRGFDEFVESLSLVADVVTQGEESWFRALTPREVERPAGFVTPAFEVIVDDRIEPEDVATIASCAELVRIDRMVTFKLGPDSVVAGARIGVSLGALLASLDRVGTAPIPSNVRDMVTEWHRRYAAIVARPMVAFVVPASFVGLGAELAARFDGVAHDGTIIVPERFAAQAAEYLKTSTHLDVLEPDGPVTVDRRRIGPDDDDDRLDDDHDGFERSMSFEEEITAEIAHALEVTTFRAHADPELRARFLADRDQSFAASRAGVRSRIERGASSTSWLEEWEHIARRATEATASPAGKEAIAALSKRRRELDAELDTWVRALEPEHGPKAWLLAMRPDAIPLYLVLGDAARARVRKSLSDVSPNHVNALCLEHGPPDRGLAESIVVALEDTGANYQIDLAALRIVLESRPPADAAKRIRGTIAQIEAKAAAHARAATSGRRPRDARPEHAGGESASSRRRVPIAAGATPKLTLGEMRSRLQKARNYGGLVRITSRLDGGGVVDVVRVLDVVPRGDGFVVLTVEPETDEHLSFDATHLLDVVRV